MPKWSWMTLARGAKQLVVQEALLEKREAGRVQKLSSFFCYKKKDKMKIKRRKIFLVVETESQRKTCVKDLVGCF